MKKKDEKYIVPLTQHEVFTQLAALAYTEVKARAKDMSLPTTPVGNQITVDDIANLAKKYCSLADAIDRGENMNNTIKGGLYPLMFKDEEIRGLLAAMAFVKANAKFFAEHMSTKQNSSFINEKYMDALAKNIYTQADLIANREEVQ